MTDMQNIQARAVTPFAVIVTYAPQWEQTLALVKALEPQCAGLILVDNGSQPAHLDPLLAALPAHTVVVRNSRNLGIAAAQNAGIREALARAASHIVLFDQDSKPAPDMIEKLLAAEAGLLAEGKAVAAVGPQLIDENTGAKAPFISFAAGRKQRVVTTPDQPRVKCFSLLASGTLIRAGVFDIVGLMEEALFIEYVDVEWGARAHARNLDCYGVGEALLYHNLGDDRIRVMKNFFVPLHKPLRHYYTMRNAIFMQKQRYVPGYWKRSDLVRTVAGFFIFALFNPPRLMQLRMMLRGIGHGITGRYGPY